MFERSYPKASIIIPNWFTPNQDGKYGKNETYWFASNCLRALVDNTPEQDFELILIDNGSTLTVKDLPQDYATPEWYWAQGNIVVQNKANIGFGPACNQGFALARGKYVVCMNNDVLVWEGWLDAVIAPFSNSLLTPPCGISMPALVKGHTVNGVPQKEHLRDARVALTLKKEDIDMETHAGQYHAGAEFGSLWATTREILDKLKAQEGHYFDENFKLGMGEDRDLWDRVRLLGYQTYRTHDTRIFHQGNLTICKVENRKDYTLPNREYLARKREQRTKASL